MNLDQRIGKLFETKGMWFSSIVPFIPDTRLSSPIRIVSPGCNDLQADPVIYEVFYFNGY